MSSSTPAASATSTAASATSSAAASLSMPSQYKVVGIILAVVSGVLIGGSFVFKKKGLVKSQVGHEAGEGVAYLKSALWWTGMIMMILGEICNFAAYAFVDAIIVTPLGALSVVISAILSSFFLNEKLTFFGWVGCFLCIVGSVVIALNGPKEQSVSTIREFQKLFLSVGFLVFGSVLIVASLVIIFFVAPRFGKKNMIWYILVCSLIGGLSVSCTQGLGTAIVTSIRGDNQFNYWFTYFLLIFVVVTLLTEIYYLNIALALFNTAMVTPTYYVIFTFFTLVTSVILYQGFKATVTEIITVVMGFLVICAGITILQMSKVDPTTLSTLDRKSTILLAANRSTQDAEKGDLNAIEEPGVDAIRGSFGAVASVVRARSAKSSIRSRRAAHGHSGDSSLKSVPSLGGMTRHQLYDAPVPPLPDNAAERVAMFPQSPKKSTTVQFREEDVVGHEHPSDPARQSLMLDDFIQRTASPQIRPVYDQYRQDSDMTYTEEHSQEIESPVRQLGGRYPPHRELDKEESMSLVSGAREDESEHGVVNGGIRLVPTLPRR